MEHELLSEAVKAREKGRQYMLCKLFSYINYENFNLSYRINIQREGRRGVGGKICKSVITQSNGSSRL